MTTKTIDQLCARDLGRRVRVNAGNGDVAEGNLRWVRQYGRGESRFALFNRTDMYEIQVGMFNLGGLHGRKEVQFL